MFDRVDGQLVGGIGLTQVRRGVAQTGTLGYWIGQRFQRNGFTTEAVRLVVQFAFQTLRLHRVEAACLPEMRPAGGCSRNRDSCGKAMRAST